ncbi:MAG TPA: peptide-N-glycosidase F-related protein [Polyangiaceae bacterium]
MLPLFSAFFSCLAFPACSSSATPAGAGGGDDGGSADGIAQPGPPYTQQLLQDAHIGSNSSKPDFHTAGADVALAGGPFAKVNLVVDLVSPCFPFSNWKTDAPPAGQSWPADCDAFDRNFEMALIDATAPQGTPGLELVRAITPFGGPEHIEQDVTDVFNAVQGTRTFQVTIPTYSDSAGKVSGSNGGWTVSAHLDVTPGAPPANVLAVIPLYYGSVTSGQNVTDVPFTVPPGTTSSRLEYRVTGHGGANDTSSACIGPADEFCQRPHQVFLDGQSIAQKTPWRTDCTKLCTLVTGGPFGGQYCQENPCGDPNSVTAPRANWCPGSETPPFTWTPAALSTPGDHTFRFAIANIAPGGGQWRVSATAYAYGD